MRQRYHKKDKAVPEAASPAPALDRGLHLLELIAGAGERGRAFGEIELLVQLPKASLARLLQVLIARGWAQKHPDHGRYLLGPRARGLVQTISLSDRLAAAARPFLDELSRRTGNTILALCWTGAYWQSVAKVMHPQAIPMQHVGDTDVPNPEIPWGWFTAEHCPEQPAAWPTQRDAAAYRRLGYVVDRRTIYTSRRVATPILDRGGRLLGALAAGGNPLTIPDERVDEIGRRLVEVAAAVAGAYDAAMPAST